MARCYEIPDLLALCPKKVGNTISPHFDAARIGYERWVNETLPKGFAIEVDNAEMPLLAALAWPYASEKELRAILAYMTMSFMLEEMTDREPTEISTRNSEIWIKVLGDPEAGRDVLNPHPFIKLMTKSLANDLKSAINPFHWPQVLESNVAFARCVIKEAEDRELFEDKDAIRTVEAYMEYRRETIGTRPCFVLMRATRKLYLNDETLRDEVVADMENYALDAVFIANDIYSYKKELDDNGALNNIVTVMTRDPLTASLPLQARFNHAASLFHHALKRFEDARSAISLAKGKYDAKTYDMLQRYGEGLVDWIVGNIEWSIINHRYCVYDSERDRQGRVMRLSAKEAELAEENTRISVKVETVDIQTYTVAQNKVSPKTYFGIQLMLFSLASMCIFVSGIRNNDPVLTGTYLLG
ncbi:terpenoid synthase [Coniophora puteana RWD-64-598 SS2]|uniref:Terpene synthase n=1 Tax=Coniophora puteana (strain RWD-64-598) TaxID=741705 RepID=A0A5M3MEK1_CONPW|nr:terpenoid synthase [Coniophora puteana RWD-64-598 SS2]EIW77648.1 terpenoid synthase [Coniophora puteana RWD-64-598 SS2]